MKNIRNYHPKKYDESNYEEIEKDIYKTLHETTESLKSVEDEEKKKFLKSLDGWKLDEAKKKYYIEYNGQRYYKFSEEYANRGGIFANILDKIFEETSPEPIYVTSLVFEQEPAFGENDPSSSMISQYPLEDVLDKFFCYISDFYDNENKEDKENAYQEFASKDIDNIRQLRTIIGKHVYNKEEDDRVKLIIE